MNSRQTFVEKFRATHESGKSFKNGKWGWQTINGCLDLRTCVHKSKSAREMAAIQAYEMTLICPLCNSNKISDDQGLCDNCSERVA